MLVCTRLPYLLPSPHNYLRTKRGREMAHWVKCLLHKHEEQNLMPQTHREMLGMGHPLVNPVMGRRQNLVSPKTVRDYASKNKVHST